MSRSTTERHLSWLGKFSGPSHICGTPIRSFCAGIPEEYGGGGGFRNEAVIIDELARVNFIDWTDSRVQKIYGGTNAIMKEIIGRSW